MEKPKTINSLMKYLRDEKNIDIHGSSQKIKFADCKIKLNTLEK